MSTRSAVIVFTKLPLNGRVKTRLLGMLSALGACELHMACLRDSVAVAGSVRRCLPALFVAGRRATATRLAQELKLKGRWRVERQTGADLGARMRNAFAEFFREGFQKVVIIGTDTPWMGRKAIERALRLLDSADVVLGPAEDGGYYLVGARQLVAQMFQGIAWGTSQVYPRTTGILRRLKVPYRFLPPDFDLDRPKDLQRAAGILRRRPERAANLSRWIAEWEESSGSSRRRRPAHPGRTRLPGRA